MSFAALPSVVPPNSIETVSGRFVDALDPDPLTICLSDIAYALSRQVRYAGHSLGEPYSVAQHAVFVTKLLTIALDLENKNTAVAHSFNLWMADKTLYEKLGLSEKKYPQPVPVLHPHITWKAQILMRALHHDDTEAYLVDVPSPVKRHPTFRPAYTAMEQKLHEAIFTSFDVKPIPPDPYIDKAIIWADGLALQIEAAHLMPSRGRGWAGNLPHFDLSMMDLMPEILPWNKAREEYLEACKEFGM